MTRTLTDKTRATVKATIPALSEHGATITAAMYRRLFENTEIRALFNLANQGESGAQVHALAAAVLGYARNIDNLAALAPIVERIAQKHIGFHILPWHYDSVATALLGALGEVLGDAATDDIMDAWGEAFWFLADILRTREISIRHDIESHTGGWHGWRRFEVAEKIRESSVVTSFILRPVDGGPVARHKPGQYLTLRFDAVDEPNLKRNYSISCAPNEAFYRISVKREANGKGGSRHLHDHADIGTVIELTPPAGDFFLEDAPTRPVILLSGGVGLTPMVSMVETIAAGHPGLNTHYIHGTISSATHAMDAHVRALARMHGNIAVASFYSDPLDVDAAGTTHDVTGMITIAWLSANTPLHNADIYLCGPKPFLRAFIGGLSRAGVADARIHYEFFGPADELIAA